MHFPVWFKWIAFFIVIFTSLILPIVFLEPSFLEYGKTLMEWSKGNSFFISLLVLNLGAIFGYCVGRFFGRPIAKFIVGEKDLNDAEKSSKNFDVIGLILSRPVPAFAELSTLAAGITKMNFLKFICVVFTVNIGVAVIFAGLGAAALTSSSSTIAFFGAAILPAIFYFTYRKIYKD